MANSPAPFAGPMPYEDFEVTNITYTPTDQYGNDYNYEFTIDITNNGEWFLELYDLHIEEASYSLNCNYYEVLAPGDSGSYSGLCEKNLPLEELTFHGYGYAVTMEAEYTSITYDYTYDYKDENDETLYYIYYFNVEGMEIDSEYYYSMIVSANYKGEHHCHYDYSARSTIAIELNDHFEKPEEEISIDHIYLIQGRYRGSNTGEEILLVVIIALLVIVFGPFILVPIVLVVGMVVVPIIIAISTAKKRKKKEESSD